MNIYLPDNIFPCIGKWFVTRGNRAIAVFSQVHRAYTSEYSHSAASRNFEKGVRFFTDSKSGSAKIFTHLMQDPFQYLLVHHQVFLTNFPRNFSSFPRKLWNSRHFIVMSFFVFSLVKEKNPTSRSSKCCLQQFSTYRVRAWSSGWSQYLPFSKVQCFVSVKVVKVSMPLWNLPLRAILGTGLIISCRSHLVL